MATTSDPGEDEQLQGFTINLGDHTIRCVIQVERTMATTGGTAGGRRFAPPLSQNNAEPQPDAAPASAPSTDAAATAPETDPRNPEPGSSLPEENNLERLTRKRKIQKALEDCHGDPAAAAQALKMDVELLRKQAVELGINVLPKSAEPPPSQSVGARGCLAVIIALVVTIGAIAGLVWFVTRPTKAPGGPAVTVTAPTLTNPWTDAKIQELLKGDREKILTLAKARFTNPAKYNLFYAYMEQESSVGKNQGTEPLDSCWAKRASGQELFRKAVEANNTRLKSLGATALPTKDQYYGSYACAAGPLQFLVTTGSEVMGRHPEVDANKDGVFNPWDPAEALEAWIFLTKENYAKVRQRICYEREVAGIEEMSPCFKGFAQQPQAVQEEALRQLRYMYLAGPGYLTVDEGMRADADQHLARMKAGK